MNDITHFDQILTRNVINTLRAEQEKIQYFPLAKSYDNFEMVSAHNPMDHISLMMPMEVNGGNDIMILPQFRFPNFMKDNSNSPLILHSEPMSLMTRSPSIAM